MCLDIFPPKFGKVYILEKLLLLLQNLPSPWMSKAACLTVHTLHWGFFTLLHWPSEGITWHHVLEPLFLVEMTLLISVACGDVIPLARCFSWPIINVKFGSVWRYCWEEFTVDGMKAIPQTHLISNIAWLRQLTWFSMTQGMVLLGSWFHLYKLNLNNDWWLWFNVLVRLWNKYFILLVSLAA